MLNKEKCIKVYIKEIPTDNRSNYKHLVSPEIWERAERFLSEKNALQIITGDLLLRRALREEGLSDDTPVYISKPYGKPYVMEKGFHFNLSHSGSMVVCATSDIPIGIDIEQLRKNISLSPQRCLSERELGEWDDFGHKYFFRKWVIKESYLKYTGQGLTVPMNTLDESNGFIYLDGREKSAARCTVFRVGEDYIGSLCCATAYEFQMRI